MSLFQESVQIFLACGSNAVNIIRGTVANFVSSCNFSVSFENQQCTIKLCRCYIDVLANIVKKLATVHFLNVQTNQNVTLQRFFCQLNKHSISPFLKIIIPSSFGFVNRFLTKEKKKIKKHAYAVRFCIAYACFLILFNYCDANTTACCSCLERAAVAVFGNVHAAACGVAIKHLAAQNTRFDATADGF